MKFQIRHKTMGVYQGSFLGFGFWYPMSEMPEQGYLDFPTEKEAQIYIDFLCSDKCAKPLRREDLSIELFDVNESNRITIEGLLINKQSKLHQFIVEDALEVK